MIRSYEFNAANANSGWRMSISRCGDYIRVGMHFGDKVEPTHWFVVTKDEWQEMSKWLGVRER